MTLQENEYYRVNSYYWKGMIYIVLEEKDGKSLCQIKGSKNTPKWIKSEQLSKTSLEF
jgi:hypothetical protein